MTSNNKQVIVHILSGTVTVITGFLAYSDKIYPLITNYPNLVHWWPLILIGAGGFDRYAIAVLKYLSPSDNK